MGAQALHDCIASDKSWENCLIDEQSLFPFVINTRGCKVISRAGWNVLLIQSLCGRGKSQQTEGAGSHLSKHTLNTHDIINGFFAKKWHGMIKEVKEELYVFVLHYFFSCLKSCSTDLGLYTCCTFCSLYHTSFLILCLMWLNLVQLTLNASYILHFQTSTA